MNFKSLIQKIELDPRQLFLIDGFGAGVTAFMLGIVLVRFESFFGIPRATLYLLAGIPVLFMLYDIICFYKAGSNLLTLLKGIAIANLIYCCVSIGFALKHSGEITIWGWLYVIGEILIIVALVIIELRIANKIQRNSQKV